MKLKLLTASAATFLAFSACNDPAKDLAYSKCVGVEADKAVTQNSCPGASGTWDRFEVVRDANANVTSSKRWCGESASDHPATQADYDGNITLVTPLLETSNADFKLNDDCVSGTTTKNSDKELTQNVWHKI